jgi:hypothetical protein
VEATIVVDSLCGHDGLLRLSGHGARLHPFQRTGSLSFMVFLFLLGLIIIPMWTYLVCSLFGKGCSWLVRKCKKQPKRNAQKLR